MPGHEKVYGSFVRVHLALYGLEHAEVMSESIRLMAVVGIQLRSKLPF